MNQEILIVFTLFLLITILLMLLLSDAKEKGKRIRILAGVSGNLPSSGTMENIRAFLEKLSSENNFAVRLADENNPADFQSSDRHSVILRFHFPTESIPENKLGEIWVDPANPKLICIAADADPSLLNDPDLLLRVRDSILRAADI